MQWPFPSRDAVRDDHKKLDESCCSACSAQCKIKTSCTQSSLAQDQRHCFQHRPVKQNGVRNGGIDPTHCCFRLTVRCRNTFTDASPKTWLSADASLGLRASSPNTQKDHSVSVLQEELPRTWRTWRTWICEASFESELPDVPQAPGSLSSFHATPTSLEETQVGEPLYSYQLKFSTGESPCLRVQICHTNRVDATESAL